MYTAMWNYPYFGIYWQHTVVVFLPTYVHSCSCVVMAPLLASLLEHALV